MFVVADKVGGQVMGAFDGERPWSASRSRVPGTRSGHVYLHSHMLAVRKDYRNGGLGRRLKLLQREDALARGIRTDRVDFRSAGNQERVSEYRKARRDRAALQHQPVRDHFVAAAGWSAQRPPDCGMVAEVEARRDAAGERDRIRHFRSSGAIAVPAEIYEWKAAAETRAQGPAGAGAQS